MTVLLMFFSMAVATVAQALLPSHALLGHMQPPVLFAVTLYYAFTRPRGAAVWVALVAGLLQDAFSLIPLGYSSFAFCVAVFVINRTREEVFVRQWTTHALAGALGYFGVCWLLYAMLKGNDHLQIPLYDMIRKTLGGALLGAVAAPAVFRLMLELEHSMGTLREVSA